MRILMAVVVLAACGSKSDNKAPEPTTKVTEPAPKAADTKPAPPAKTKRPPPTKDQLAALKQHMKAGWALQKDNKWADAVVEFEAALVAVPEEQRALSELGWSAMNAGDFPKARKADEAAIKVAVDKKVKAAGYYNLGLVQEKTGDKAGALKSFHASLALRPNKTVEQAVARLGANPKVEPAFCAAGQKPCDCVLAAAYDEVELESAKCEEAKKPALPVKAFRLYHISSDAFLGSQWTYALDENNQLVGLVAGDSFRSRTDQKTELVKAELKAIGGHYVLWLETKNTSMSTHPSADFDDAMNTEVWETRLVTLCVVADPKTKTKTSCPLRDVPIAQLVETGTLDSTTQELKTTTTTVDLTLSDDGTATVKLVKGASDPQLDALVGPHKLW